MTTESNLIPLDAPIKDFHNAEHDMLRGPCACGAWHHDENDYFYRLSSRDQAWVMKQKAKAQSKESGSHDYREQQNLRAH